ncbi:MAG: glycerophosphoryl diester phosphodiesterase [Halieaceae bacterium]
MTLGTTLGRAVAFVLVAPQLFAATVNTESVPAGPAHAPLVIAHRGASGYLPEHTLPAKALAHAMGADYLEQDVVLSSDDVPVVLHDIHLGPTTDVAEHFPQRQRADGHYYAIDFTLAELRTLRAGERRGSDGKPVFPHRFPGGAGLSAIPTLAEEIALVRGLNHSRGKNVGLYIEMKGTAFHRAAGKDLPAAVLSVLREGGWGQPADRIFLQSFEPDALRYLRFELKTPLPLIQLIGENSWEEDGAVDYDYLRSDAGLDQIASYADGIGPWLMHLYLGRDTDSRPLLSDLAARARARGLAVHPYTFRADQLPSGIGSFEELHQLFLIDLAVDGIFTDFPDLSRKFIQSMTPAP